MSAVKYSMDSSSQRSMSGSEKRAGTAHEDSIDFFGENSEKGREREANVALPKSCGVEA